MGALTAAVLWNGGERGTTDTMWMGTSPSWMVQNKFNCRRAGTEDALEVRLFLKSAKRKEPALLATAKVLWRAPEGEEDAAAAAARNYMSDAVLDGDKVYFPLVPEPDYRGVAHGDCAIGIVIS